MNINATKKNKTLVIANHKGGTGKTTITVNMAYCLSSMGYKVLLIDADSQGNASSFYQRHDITKFSIADLLKGKCETSKVIRHTEFGNLDIIPSNKTLEFLKEDELQNRIFTLDKVLVDIKNNYDFCIIDCAPAFTIATQNALAMADDVIVPVDFSKYALDGLDTMKNWIITIQADNEKLNFLGCVLNKYQAKRKFINEFFQRFALTNCPYMDTGIRFTSKVMDSGFEDKPLCFNYKKSLIRTSIADDFMELTDEYLRKVGK